MPNPYMPQANPYTPSSDQPPIANPDEMADGPQNPPVNPIPTTTTQPRTTAPRTMPGGGPADMSTPSATDIDESPSRGATATRIAIRCYACGQRGEADLAAVLAAGRCQCGSDDLDLDFTVESASQPARRGPGPQSDAERCPRCWGKGWVDMEGMGRAPDCPDCKGTGIKKGASWEIDAPMDQVKPAEAVTQAARCSNCLTEFSVTVSDPADPIGNCPNCGSAAVSAAGADGTTTRATASTSNPGGGVNLHFEAALPGDGGLGGNGLWATLVNMVNFARSSGDDKIPEWFKKYFSRLLLPEEIASGRWETGGAGSYAWGTMGAKSAAGNDYCKDCGTPIPKPEKDRIGANVNGRCRSCHMRRQGKEAAAPKWKPLPEPEGDPYAESDREKRRQKRREREREDDRIGDERANSYKRNADGKFAVRHAQKIAEITQGILATNPSMERSAALKLAQQTVQRYPKMVGRSG